MSNWTEDIDHVLESIDGALEDWNDEDTVRWSPEPETAAAHEPRDRHQLLSEWGPLWTSVILDGPASWEPIPLGMERSYRLSALGMTVRFIPDPHRPPRRYYSGDGRPPYGRGDVA